MNKPNILLIMTDQQRADAMNCSGDWIQTPNMDRIAEKGVRFSNCVTNSPVCIPARLSLATGLYPHNTGVWTNQRSQMSKDQPTWMQQVRKAGYRTSLFGKTHLHPHTGDLREREFLMKTYGLDDVDEIGGPRASQKILSHMTAWWRDEGVWKDYQADYKDRFENKPHTARPSTLGLKYYADVYVGQRAKSYIEHYDLNEPWCCWVSFGGPHEPWDAPDPYGKMYTPNDMPEVRPIPRSFDGRPKGYLDTLLAKSPNLDSGDVAALRANYAGNVSLIDDQIGQIIETISSRGQLNNTAIILVSDHGEMNGDAGLLYKENFLDGAVRVPLVISAPGTMKGVTCPSPVEWFDVGPTIVELANGCIEYPQFASSLCPVLQDVNREHRPDAISEYRGEIMLLNQEWKIALNNDGLPYMLFDLINDPEERENLAGRPEMKATEDILRLRILERLQRSHLQGSGYHFDFHG